MNTTFNRLVGKIEHDLTGNCLWFVPTNLQ